MSTHGVFVIKMGDTIWGFHVTSDGSCVMDFHEKYKDLTDPEKIFKKALDFFSEMKYSDRPWLNFYKEKYDEKENYARATNYTCYFDGEAWFNDWE